MPKRLRELACGLSSLEAFEAATKTWLDAPLPDVVCVNTLQERLVRVWSRRWGHVANLSALPLSLVGGPAEYSMGEEMYRCVSTTPHFRVSARSGSYAGLALFLVNPREKLRPPSHAEEMAIRRLETSGVCVVRGNSYVKLFLALVEYMERAEVYACDCGAAFSDVRALRRHERASRRKGVPMDRRGALCG
jgi:hypothetical protein